MQAMGVCRLAVTAGHVLAVLAAVWALGLGVFARSLADLLAPLPPGDARWGARGWLTLGGVCGLALALDAALRWGFGDVARGLGKWGPDPAVLRHLAILLRLGAGGTGVVLVARGVLELWGRFLVTRVARSALPGSTTAAVMGLLGPFTGGVVLVGMYAWRRWGGADVLAIAVGGLCLAVCWQGVTGMEVCVWRVGG